MRSTHLLRASAHFSVQRNRIDPRRVAAQDLVLIALRNAGERLPDGRRAVWIEADRVREIGLEHDVVGTDRFHQLDHSFSLEPEAAENLPMEILRWLHAEP